MSRLFEGIGHFVVRRGKWLLLLSALAVLPAFQLAGRIEMQTGLDTFVSEDARVYQEFLTYSEHFGARSSLMVMLSGDVTDVQTLRAEERLADSLVNDSRIAGVRSLATSISSVIESRDGMGYLPANQGEIDSIVEGLPPAVRSAFLPDAHYSFMFVELASHVPEADLEKVVIKVDKAISESRFPPGVNAETTGEAKFSVEMEKEMGKSLGFMLVAAVIAMFFVLGIVFRHVRRPLLPLLGVVVGTLWTFGVTGLLDVPLTMASMAVFPLLIGIGIDYFIQFHNRIDEEVRTGKAVGRAVIDGIRSIGPAVGLAVICGGLGFAALFRSPVPMMVDFGGLSLLGIVLCFVAALIFMCPLVYFTYRRRGARIDVQRAVRVGRGTSHELPVERVLGKVALFCSHNALPIVTLVVLLTILGYTYDQQVGVSMDEEDYAPPDMPMVIQANKLESILGSSTSVNVLLQSDDVTAPDVVEWMQGFGEYVQDRHSMVSQTTSLADVVMSANGGSIPGTSAEMSQLMQRLPREMTDPYVEGTSLAMMTVTAEGMKPEASRDFIDALRDDLEWMSPPPGTSATLTGGEVLYGGVFDALTTGRYEMTFTGLLFIFVALLIVYRDWFKALVPILPVVLVTGLSGGMMYLMGMTYTSVSATMGALIIGLGVEYFLLVMTRYYEERDRGHDPYESMRVAVSRVGVALISSGATTMGGFGALMLSSFPVLQTFGTVTVMIFALLLMLTFTLLPAVLVPLDIWRTRMRQTSIRSLVAAGITRAEET